MTTNFGEILTLFDNEELVIAEEGEWEQNGKCQFRYTVVEYKDKFYELQQSRSGSYHTDWYYNTPDIIEVVRKENTVTQVYWEAV
jgi:hypothetical protein